MNRTLAIGLGIVTVAYAHDITIALRNRKKLTEAQENNAALFAIAQHLQKRNEYLAGMLDAHDIPQTEFDRIIMNNL